MNKKIKLYGDTLLIGKRGQGKSYMAARLAVEDKDCTIATNVDINESQLAKVLRDKYGEEPKKIIKISHPRDFEGIPCAYRWLDEAQKYFPARKFKDVDERALAAIAEERKMDAWTVYTVQALRNLDVLVAAFCDNIVKAEMISLPLIGWIWPDCVRPKITCRYCGKTRRDAEGDQSTPMRKLLGYGSAVRWTEVDPESMVKARTLDGSAQVEEDVSALRKGWCLFDVDVANVYDSGQKIELCEEHEKKEKNRRAAAPEAQAGAPSLPF